MIGSLPESLTVAGVDYPIRSDYRNVLQLFEASSDSDLSQDEKWIVAIYLLFEDFSCADDVFEAIENGFDIEDAAKQITWFILMGKDTKDKKELPAYDWEQDEQMIFSAVNKVYRGEVREVEYMHWWTFLGYFNEIDEGMFSFIVGIRDKLNHHKKLEKHEREFLNKNRDLVKIKPRLSKEEAEQKAEEDRIWSEIL